MNVLAALCVGGACALAAGALLGVLPRFHLPRVRAPRELGLSIAVGLVSLVIVRALSGSVWVALVPAGALALLPRAYRGRKARVHSRELQAAWPDGLRDLLASIASGRSLTQAVGALAEHGPLPLRDAFAGVPDRARTLGLGAALEIVKEELADPTSDRIIEVLLVAQERGGAIVRNILVDLVDATTRDLKLLDAIDTEGLEMRINARAVVVMPWLVLVALTARSGPFREFYRSSSGVFVLIVAGVMSVVGVMVLRRLGREVREPRVLAR